MAEKAINKILKQQERKLNETGTGSKARACPSPSKLLSGSRLSSPLKIKKTGITSKTSKSRLD